MSKANVSIPKEFRFITRSVKTPFKFTLALDFGNEPGSWAVFVIGHTAFGLGYLPKLSYFKKEPRVKPIALTAFSEGMQKA